MGIDYSAKFGIGYQVVTSEQEDMYPDDYLDDLPLKENRLKYIKAGDGYNGDYYYYIVLIDPFKDGYDLTGIKLLLDDFILKNKIITVGEFGCVGDLYIH